MGASGRLTAVDAALVAAYLLGVVGWGVAQSRRRGTADDFFLASRSTRWPLIGLALLASNVSSTTLIGLAGQAYASGIAAYDYEWMAGVVLVVFCVFLLPIVLRAQVYTMPEYLEGRYNRACRLYFSLLTLALNVAVDMSAALYGGALLLSLALPGAPVWVIVAAVATAAAIYTAAGGLRVVMRTEALQAGLLLGASTLVAAFTFHRAGGLRAVLAGAPQGALSLVRPAGDAVLPWPALLTGVPILGFYYWCNNQFMVQRVLSARSEDHGRWGALFAGLLKLPLLWLMVLPGVAAVSLGPHLARPDMVYPTLLFRLLPPGLLGLALAGFVAAVMGSVASTLNSGSTLFTMDFVRAARPGMSGRALVATGRAATVALAVLAMAWAPQIGRFPSLWQYLQSVLAFAAPPIAALYLLGVFWPRANGAGALCGIAAGVAGGAGLFALTQVTRLWPLHFLYVAPILFALTTAAVAAGSLLTAPPAPETLAGLVWTGPTLRAELAAPLRRPAWTDYRLLGAALLALTALIVWRFR